MHAIPTRDGTTEASHSSDDEGSGCPELDAVPFTVVRLDRGGRIVSVNETWRKFASRNGGDSATTQGVGLSYLEACESSEDPLALGVAEDLRALLGGRRARVDATYPCHSASEVRWFRLEAHPLGDGSGAVLVHTDVTAQRTAEVCMRIQTAVSVAHAEEQSLLDACRELMPLVCEGLMWDVGTAWIPDAESHALECASVRVRSGFTAPSLEQTLRSMRLAPGDGVPGQVLTQRAPIWCDAIDAADWAEPMREAGLHRSFAVPVQCDGEVLAVLEFFSTIAQRRRDDVVDLLAIVGAQLGAHELRARAKRQAQEAEAAMRQARAQLLALVECAPSFILMVGLDGRIQFINRVGHGLRVEDLLGTPWLGLVPPEDRARVEAIFETVVRTGAPQTYEVQVRPGGSSAWFGNHMGALREGDMVVGVVIISNDITEIKRAQSESLAAQRLAAVGTLAAGVAHEINTPIQFVSDSMHFLNTAATDMFGLVDKYQATHRAIAEGAAQGEVERLMTAAIAGEADADLDYLREHVPKAFERCGDGLMRAATIVRALKEFAHPGKGQAAPTDLNRAIGNTLAIARNEFRFVADLETNYGDLPPVLCVIADINQVVLNLVVNAAHAIGDAVAGTDRRGVLGVRTRCDDGFAFIEVSDTGLGIPLAIREQIFDPFFTTKEPGKGTGQGLALAWTVVRDKHRGEISFETAVGKGTTFTIRLPIDGVASEPSEAKS